LHLKKKMQHFGKFSVNIPMDERCDDRQLIQDILQGKAGAFEELILAYKKLVMHIVFRMVRHPSDREDICQDVFLKIYQNLGSFRQQAKLSTWIGRIAYNSCLNHIEKKKDRLMEDYWQPDQNWEDLEGFNTSPEAAAELSDLNSKVQAEISKMPVNHRTALTLYHVDGLSYQEVAEVMNLPEGTVKSYLYRARQHLKQKLTSQYQMQEQ
jgi:RNA polymerase sigma factor (sigma-70 family)